MASKADIYALYEQSVQCVEAEIDFVDATFQEIRGRKARSMREDFCGTANTSHEWIKRRKTNKAVAVDLDKTTLAWADKEKISKLMPAEKERITLLNSNVLNVNSGKVDMILAMNFSYWLFKERRTMIQYFKTVHDSLVDDGILFLDAFGGYEGYQVTEESTVHDGFTYIWDQARYHPVTNHMVCHMHFKFKDGSKINRAFTYKWRLWGLPEITEMLQEAGFKPTVYWEGTDDDGDNNGIFQPDKKGDADASWIAYIVAEKHAGKTRLGN